MKFFKPSTRDMTGCEVNSTADSFIDKIYVPTSELHTPENVPEISWLIIKFSKYF